MLRGFVERSKYDMSFKYFLDMAPEDSVIVPSFLTNFRRICLQEVGLLDLLIQQAVEIALEKGLIKSKTIIGDATHTKSRCNQKAPIDRIFNGEIEKLPIIIKNKRNILREPIINIIVFLYSFSRFICS